MWPLRNKGLRREHQWFMPSMPEALTSILPWYHVGHLAPAGIVMAVPSP